MHMNPTKDDIQISHIPINHSRNQHKKEKRVLFSLCIFFYYYLLMLLSLLICASAFIYLADICQKHCAISVLEKKMCNVNSYNNSLRHCYFYLHSKCIFLSDLSSKKKPKISLIFLRSACTSSYQDYITRSLQEWMTVVCIFQAENCTFRYLNYAGIWVYRPLSVFFCF